MRGMKTSLINTVWFSEKRKNLLLLLYEGERDLEQIKKSLNVTTRSIMPQIKTLKNNNLIMQEQDQFSLTTIGKTIIKNMLPFLCTSRIIEENKDFWASRNFDAIPPHLFSKIRYLGHYFLIEPDINHMFELPREFVDNIPKSKSIMTFVSYLHPMFLSLYLKAAQSGAKISLFVSEVALEKMKNEYFEQFNELMKMTNATLFLCKENPKIPMVTVTDWFSYICLFNDEGRYDHRDIISFDESSLKWCNELFDYYRTNSEKLCQITEVE
ncbi:winged helix-turn-helix domain-containing protein [Methanolobus sp.]|jgi:predicted transcriptional regulator|uniref:helix-turn-helix transcriptional regulator n=1 Tax=Methanolobus sp. TaxID=1874737 RepID=UPI0025D06102|nr:winged helix-turn-helix domain-containing protein [Methanolobus sp.]